ncbi:MAG TPA: M20/M25/M40 family metallo-hydrolase, partial [Spirochaetia bacterium]|nr:M20/M25/M40 family metallo-hydrolase [Spirochaetia bacterium]
MHPALALIFLPITLLAVLAVRALGTPRAPAPGRLDPAALEPFAGIENKLAALVRLPTVSRFEAAQEDPAPFRDFPRELERLFPTVHARLRRDAVGDRALLYEWPGSDPALAPAILAAHYDVVPPGEIPWTRPPFSGDAADGFVWGRGSQDTKVTLTGILAAAERLLGEGYRPARTLFFAFGGDEEVGGARGAAALARTLRERGVKASFLSAEGGIVADGMLAFAD